ncbi:MipA/OmpV family protein [Chitinilyticum piscinae]|nr:MipA/OmpV family protein [Chitinilyticum piscinae]
MLQPLRRLLAGLLLCSSLPAYADFEMDLGSLGQLTPEGALSPVPEGLVVGGIGLTYTPRYQEQQQKVLPIPGFIYMGQQFMFLGDRLRYYVYQENGLGVYGYGRVRFGNLDPEDPTAFSGLNKRKAELEAGIGANLLTPYALLTARVSHDVTGTSKGGDALLWADFPIVRDNWLIMPGTGVFWRSSKLSNYYFGGVSAAEAAQSGYAAYDTGSTLGYGASLLTSWRINRDWVSMAGVFYERYDRAIADSPLVQHGGEMTFLLGAGYMWK